MDKTRKPPITTVINTKIVVGADENLGELLSVFIENIQQGVCPKSHFGTNLCTESEASGTRHSQYS